MLSSSFSVCMATYKNDDPENLRTAINSIYTHQTVKPVEVILVVDGPIPDSLRSIISEMTEQIDVLKVIYLEQNMGHAVARQTGVEAASTPLIALMDADDISLPDRFEKQLEIFKQYPEVSVVGGLIHEFVGEPSNVLGIRRKQEYLLHDLGGEKIHDSDVLLVQGAWKDIARLRNESSNWVVLGEPLQEAAKVTLDYKAPIAAAIMIAMIVMMAVDSIPVAPVTSVLLAAILMVMTGCIRNVEAAYKTINWQTIVLFAAMLPMSTALEKTGVSGSIADFIINTFGSAGPYVALAAVYAATSVMTIFISNTVTAVLMAPIALQCAVGIGASPLPYLFAVSVAASMCFASPFSTPPNALVMPAGQYTFMDYIKVGLPLQIIMGVVMVFALPMIFPF